MYSEAVATVCNKFLSKQSFQKFSKNSHQDINRRSLRLSNGNNEDNKNKIAFNPDIMYNSIVKRTKGFENARKMINEVKGYEDIEKSLQVIEKRLIKFGYGLNFDSFYSYRNKMKNENLFEKFELID
jgi:23S rRNA-/tRNA-specific pseudouridylate synthase